VRRDLTLFGQFGRRGVGYDVADLIQQLRRILGTHVPWNLIVIGAGELSRALIRYRGFAERGFRVVAAFDIDPRKTGKNVGGVPILPMDQLPQVIEQHAVRLAVLAVPEAAAQQAADRLAEAGIEGILNFASMKLEAPPKTFINQVDITAHLEQLSFEVSNYRP
jgi:redox-sensing transcriptional repressor